MSVSNPLDRDEKYSPTVEKVEDAGHAALNNIDYDEEFSPEEQKKIIRRIDLRLVTITGLAYCVSLMDRTNLSMAAVAGYSIVVLMFFVPYVIFQPPMTVITRKLGPTVFLGSIVISWGAILIMTACRVLLGLLEAGYFPGCVYLLSSWYARYDVQKRFSVFYLIGCVASALAGILAFGLMQLDGSQGLAGWRWIFILEGVITGAIGILAIIFLVDFPDRAHKSWKFLSERECAFVVRRINRDRSDGDAEPFTLKRFLKPALDMKIWGFAVIFFCVTTVSYAIAYFLPIILSEGMGFDTGTSQCLVAPPYAAAGFVMYGTSWVGDKYRMRGPVLIFNALLCIIGLPMMGFASSHAVQYVGVFFTVAGSNSNIPAVMAYQANNVRGQWTRALSSATLVGFGGIGGIAGSLVFREQDKPHYRPGIWCAIACNLLLMLIVVVQSIWFKIANKRAERGEKLIEGVPGFRYTI
ncbi:putative phthalate transporter [Aspergillus foveolatus]|uniref:putative phthalate transporter n=1 Tax=Aspergillus foveolatus TaxID=210207 RepID=UPI003CCD8F42